MVLIVIWIISPIVLIPWLIYSIVQGKKKRKENDELCRQLQLANNDIASLRNQLNSTKQMIVKSDTDTAVPSAEEAVDSAIDPSPQIKMESSSESIVLTSEAEMPLIRDVETPSEAVIAVTDTEDSKQDIISKAPVTSIVEEVLKQNNSSLSERKKAEKKGLPSGTVLFGIGILFVLIAGAIFATTTWQILPAAGKVLTLLGAVSVFYISSFVAQKKLGLRETSITFFLLGSSFLSVINIGVAYFKWFGESYVLEGQQAFLVLSISVFILAICLFIGNRLYDVDLLGLLTYLFFLVGIILLVQYLTEEASISLFVSGIYIALSWVYIYIRKIYGKRVSFRNSVGILSIIYMILTVSIVADDVNVVLAVLTLIIGLIIAFEISVLLYGEVKDIGILQFYAAVFAILLPVKLFVEFSYLFAVPMFWGFAMVYAIIFKFVKVNEERELGNILSDYLSGILFLVASISALFGVTSKGYAIFFLVIWTLSLAMFVVFVFLLKNQTRSTARIMDFVNADICLLGCTIASNVIYEINEVQTQYVWLFISLIIAIVLFVCFEVQENNTAGFFPVLIADIMAMYIIGKLATDNNTLIAIVNIVLLITTVIIGRLLHKKSFYHDDTVYHIDWLGILSFVFILYVNSIDGKYIQFITYILFALYFVNYYKRIPELLSKLALSISVLLIGIALYKWPFFEITKSFEYEWNISIIMLVIIACGFIWKRIEKQYTKVACIAVFVMYYQYLVHISSEIEYLSVNNTVHIVILKLLFYFVGAAILFGFSLWRNSTPCLIATGALLAHSGAISSHLVSKWIIILPIILGIGYAVYVYYKNRKNQLIWAIIQLYLILVGFDAPPFVYIIVFIAMIVYGHMSYDLVVYKHENGIEFDWFTLVSVMAPGCLFLQGTENWTFCAMMMLAVYILSFYKRISPVEIVDRIILTVSSVILGLTLIYQPFFEISANWKTEWFLMFAWIVIVFNFAFVYRDNESSSKYYILYFLAIVSIIWQGTDAISADNVVDALILGVVMTALLIYSFFVKKKMWFLLAAVTLILQGIYTSRNFWFSIKWWVYLLVVGVVLIAIAAANEYRKRNEIETKEMNLFSDWNNW